jgi:hypothetical protein
MLITTLDHLRHLAVANSLFPPTTLKRALHRLGFVQADPIRSPARAQDLMLRHRVRSYRAGDLERRSESLGIEEDVFVNYGFVIRSLAGLMNVRPRASSAHIHGLGVSPQVELTGTSLDESGRHFSEWQTRPKGMRRFYMRSGYEVAILRRRPSPRLWCCTMLVSREIDS